MWIWPVLRHILQSEALKELVRWSLCFPATLWNHEDHCEKALVN